jgi:hypothetical protein
MEQDTGSVFPVIFDTPVFQVSDIVKRQFHEQFNKYLLGNDNKMRDILSVKKIEGRIEICGHNSKGYFCTTNRGHKGLHSCLIFKDEKLIAIHRWEK